MTTVIATCNECSDEHPLSERTAQNSADGLTTSTTRCPACSGQSYRTGTTDRDVGSERERIKTVVSDIEGVGSKTEQAILQEFISYAGLQSASRKRLLGVDGVGEQTAQRIENAV